MINLPSEIKKILNETYEQQLQKPIKVLELPCTKNHKWKEPVMVQIHEPRDQKVTCPKCGKEHYLTWSKVDNHKFS